MKSPCHFLTEALVALVGVDAARALVEADAATGLRTRLPMHCMLASMVTLRTGRAAAALVSDVGAA